MCVCVLWCGVVWCGVMCVYACTRVCMKKLHQPHTLVSKERVNELSLGLMTVSGQLQVTSKAATGPEPSGSMAILASLSGKVSPSDARSATKVCSWAQVGNSSADDQRVGG